MVSKFFTVFALLVAVAFASYPSSNKNNYDSTASHHLIVGARMPSDKLVYQENIVLNSKWLQVVSVTKTFNVSNWEYITQVRALDQKVNGNGAFASLLGGGPSAKNVTLKFKSQRGHGINFKVELYARSRYGSLYK